MLLDRGSYSFKHSGNLDMHHHSNDLSSTSTITLPLPILTSIQHAQIDTLLRSLLWEGQLPGSEQRVEILRTKGIFTNKEDRKVYIIQGVRELYEIKCIESTSEGINTASEVTGKLVFIGRGLNDAFGRKVTELILAYVCEL